MQYYTTTTDIVFEISGYALKISGCTFRVYEEKFRMKVDNLYLNLEHSMILT
jgi:hypothetical protein